MDKANTRWFRAPTMRRFEKPVQVLHRQIEPVVNRGCNWSRAGLAVLFLLPLTAFGLIYPPLVTADEQWDPLRAQTDAGAKLSERAAPPGALHVGAGQDYRSLNEAIRAARTGDTVVVHAGTYREVLGGSANSPDGGYLAKALTVQAASGARPVITGADVFTSWQAAGNGLWYTAFDSPFPPPAPGNITPDQIDPRHPYAGNLEQAFIDNEVMTQLGSRESVRGRERHFFYDATAKRVYIGTNPSGRRIEISVRPRASLLVAAGTVIRGLHFTRFSPAHKDGKATLVANADNITLEDVTVTNSAASGIMVRGNNVTLNRVSARFNGALGIQATRSDGLRIEFSRIDRNNIESFDFEDCGGGRNCVLAGTKVTYSRDIVVRYNSFSGNRSTGFWCDLDCVDAVIAGNHVANNAKHGIYYEVSRNGWIVSNVITGHRNSRVAGIKISGSANVTVHRNTLFDNYNQIIFSSDPRNSWPTPGSDIDNVDIRANVFAESVRQTGATDQFVLQPINFTGTPLSQRLRYFYRNAYLLVSAQQGNSRYRFRWEGGNYVLPRDFSVATAYRYASGAQVQLSDDPIDNFVDSPNSDFRLRSDIAGFNYNGGVNVPGSVIGNRGLFASTVNNARYPNGFGALFASRSNGPVELSVEPLTVQENVGTASVSLRLNRPLDRPLSLVVFTQIRSASPGRDYYGKTQQLNFAAGERVKVFSVVVLNDSVIELAETVLIRARIQSGGEGVNLAQDRALMTIIDDD